eukprot:TRINITY_DN2775_c0_g3_i1.p1 TRINITY_DN2775_c0_g3~~TRINITY_DN2775_c0_g3_i1.p1  ORF type:complete len:1099 (-),score=397.86 TRINITY_DN2775_c0_g3_i1:68-3364(-)
MGEELKIDDEAFWSRLKALYSSWEANRGDKNLWNGADALVYSAGESREDIVYSKTASISLWLFGLEFTQFVIVFCQSQVYILTSQKKVNMLSVINDSKAEKFIPVKFLTLVKDDATAGNRSDNISKLLEAIKESNAGKVVGVLTKEKQIGSLTTTFQSFMSEFEQRDVTHGWSALLAAKDEKEMKTIRAAAIISHHIMKKILTQHIENIIDVGKEVTHSELAAEAEKIFEDPRSISATLDPKNFDSCYTPMIQSGGQYDTKPGTPNTDDALHPGTILISLGSRYKSYCSNLARTYFVNPTTEQEEVYRLLVEAEDILLKAMRPGKTLSSAYNSALSHIEKQKPDLASKFGKSCGFSTGLEFQESALIINAKNEQTFKENMIFNVSISLNKIETGDKDPKKAVYSILLSDTVLIKGNEAQVLTDKSSKKWNEVSYALEAKGESMEVESPAKPARPAAAVKKDSEKATERKKSSSEKSEKAPRTKTYQKEEILTSRLRGGAQEKLEEKNKVKETEEKRKAHQHMLEEKQREEVEKRFAAHSSSNKSDSKESGPSAISFKSLNEYPKDLQKNRMYVDAQSESILVPIYGLMVPFHVSMVKNVSKSDEQYLRINFSVPDKFTKPEKADNMRICIKEFTYRIPDEKNLNNCLRMIKELRKRITSREKSQSTTANLVPQEKLILSKGKVPRLSDVFVRPTASGKKTSGYLEAHNNGFRFAGQKGDVVDVMYKNIKHAFLQPADKEPLAVVHFHLHNPIVIGKKRTQDVQFCTEVMEVSQALDGRSRYDPDEIEDEQRERAHRQRINNEFQNFCTKAEEAAGVEFDMPYEELSFQGVPQRASVTLQPTVHCLISITELPFFVLSLAEIELAYFERVQFSLKNFDVVFIYKDYTRPVTHVNSIPVDQLDTLKEWLDSCDIIYYEGTQSLNWPRIMAQINADPKKFLFEDGGWKFLSNESDDEEGGGSDDSDEESEYGSDGDEEAGDDDADDDDEFDEGEEEDESDFSEDDEEDEEGEDWDELEARALKEDKARANDRQKRGREYSSDDEDRPKKKRPATGAPSGKSSSSSKGSSSSSKPSSSSKGGSSSSKHSSSHKSSSSSSKKK